MKIKKERKTTNNRQKEYSLPLKDVIIKERKSIFYFTKEFDVVSSFVSILFI
jgi:hypothetical protein